MATIEGLLTDIALGVVDRNCVLVIKNLHSSVSEGTLVNWVEVVTDEEVKDDVCHYHRPLTSVSIAVLSSSVQDQIDQIQQNVLTKKLSKRVLDVSPIGLPSGLLILNNQGHAHSEDSLELFFESTRNGGEEDCVQSVMHKESGITVIPFFSSSLPTAVENILKKGLQSGHVLNKKPLTVVPYYPVFHDYVLDQLGNTETRKPKNTLFQNAKKCDELDGHDSDHHDNIQDDPALISFSSEEENEKTNLMIDGGGDIDLPRGERSQVDLPRSERSQGQTFQSEKGQARAFQSEKGQAQAFQSEQSQRFQSERGQGQVIQSGRDQGQIFSWEDDSNLFTQSPTSSENVQGCLFPSDEYGGPGKVKSEDSQNTDEQAGNLIFIGSDLPAIDKKMKQPEFGRPLKIQTADEQDRHLTKAPMETKIIKLPKHKIILLRISSFGRKQKNVEIDLNSEKDFIRLRGTREDISTVTEEMLKKLEELQQHDRKVSNEVAAILEYKMRTPDFTKQTLMGDKIYAHVMCLAKENIVRAYAFKREQAKRAVDKMLSLVDSEDITYTECHFKYLASSAWQNLVQKWENLGLVKIRVMKPEKNIRITSVTSLSDVIQDIKGELGKFSDVTGKPISVDGGRAMMLHYCLQDKMRQMESDVRHAGGQMDHRYKAGTYLVTVQGSPSVVKKTESQLHSLTNSIWEGSVNLSRLEGKLRPLTEEEKAVIIEGISSKKGKDFLKRFSIEHSCIVLFTPKSGARPDSRYEEPKGMIRSHSMPVLEPATGRMHNRYSKTGQTEPSQVTHVWQPIPS
ncbi:uncharacterized protein LOC117329643 [Pecten maximus]|uniref:uncharacterized protein LOC117329643 n=1 Tax=Pecten maximus TaxID=6579 RepID=UPI0014591AAC|nr:uncharacterized protein LOC117329643 [Pecten maximus]